MNVTLTSPADGHCAQTAHVEQADDSALLSLSGQIAEEAALANTAPCGGSSSRRHRRRA
ncbi:hypothetical protein ACQ4WX_17105 [Streptomyces lasalocidi]